MQRSGAVQQPRLRGEATSACITTSVTSSASLSLEAMPARSQVLRRLRDQGWKR